MTLGASNEYFYVGENMTRYITAEIDSDMPDCTPRLAFITPSGKTFLSDALSIDSDTLTVSFPVPSVLLDMPGELTAQLICYENENIKRKSRCFFFPVRSSVNEYAATEPMCDEGLLNTDILIGIADNKANKVHDHNTVYYTKEETNALFESIALVGKKLSGGEIFNDYRQPEYDNSGEIYQGNIATGAFSHSEGSGVTATGNASHGEGKFTVAEGECSHAQGNGCKAIGTASHAGGTGTVAYGNSSHVLGRYNIPDHSGQYAVVLGNGTGEDERANASTVDWDGNVWFAGNISSGSNGVMNDYIVEHGSSGIWTYRKWASGKKECWGAYSFGTVQTSQSWGGYNISSNITVNFITGFFTATPVVLYSGTTSDFPGHIYYHQSSDPNKVGNFNLACHNERSVSGAINIYAVGQ